ncbi:MAG TPA: cobyrinate a,c-diamide synthase [Candidatus Bacteroides merdavium]|uniref:Cobyrinate a,c-diamide synthase n=1 Tax=Candidatus Bacteroides merdavium TaxID=2838472 RepID=A0A9D2GWV4_9BACE|nr:cobyrinate a,c-diamide synthase [Candidatus Bacteroides merdavium]
MARSIPQFLIAAPMSGSGKTTISRGLMALLKGRGLKVQPYKCGPDYIDTKFHERACGRPSVNLDLFMASPAHVEQLYARYASDADACVVEGMMGMFDGYERDCGSSAEVARLLRLPVVLVVDARSAAYSLAPLLQGFLHFRPDIRFAGIIFNRVGSVRHFEMLQEVCDDLQVECLGYLPKDSLLEQGSRYLGLDFSEREADEAGRHLLARLEAHVRISRLLEVAARPVPETRLKDGVKGRGIVAVARNEESFSFLYTEHLDLLRRYGEVVFFDPEQSVPLPAETSLLYLPGGYPEKHAGALGASAVTMESVRRYIDGGGRALAECGGMIYLSQGVCLDGQPDFLPLVGVLPFSISNRKEHRKLSLGYRRFDYNGQTLRGHEFHYTQYIERAGERLLPSVARVYNARGQEVATPVFRYRNLLASYTHLYWGETDLDRLFADKV